MDFPLEETNKKPEPVWTKQSLDGPMKCINCSSWCYVDSHFHYHNGFCSKRNTVSGYTDTCPNFSIFNVPLICLSCACLFEGVCDHNLLINKRTDCKEPRTATPEQNKRMKERVAELMKLTS